MAKGKTLKIGSGSKNSFMSYGLIIAFAGAVVALGINDIHKDYNLRYSGGYRKDKSEDLLDVLRSDPSGGRADLKLTSKGRVPSEHGVLFRSAESDSQNDDITPGDQSSLGSLLEKV